ncbi:hypothetical protein JCM10207_001876 [Rhodosporidiobolus poonsookiae]
MAAAPSSNYFATAGKIALATTGVLAAATVGYAVYFDYQRRNNPVFRKKLLREHKKLDKKIKVQEEVGAKEIKQALERAVQLVKNEPVPKSAEGKEQYFMEQVALGEQLAARSPEFYVASALSFYKALKVYPAPQELLMIYQKTQPAAVFDLIMELISIDMNATMAAASSASSAGGPPKSDNPLLEELNAPVEKKSEEDDEEVEEIQVGGAGKKAASEGEASEASPSSGSSFVHVETDAVVAPSGEVEAEVTQAVVADAEEVKEAVEEVAKEEEAGEVDPPEPVLA